jgi:hypothetical protein
MAAAGMDPSQVAAARKGLEALNKELAEKYGAGPSVVAMGVGGAGGGGSGVESGEGGAAASGSDPMAAYLASLKNKLNQKRDPASVAGMQKMLGGEPIGVKMDNSKEILLIENVVKLNALIKILIDKKIIDDKDIINEMTEISKNLVEQIKKDSEENNK